MVETRALIIREPYISCLTARKPAKYTFIVITTPHCPICGTCIHMHSYIFQIKIYYYWLCNFVNRKMHFMDLLVV